MAMESDSVPAANPSFKVVLLGDTCVGKSAIARRQCYDEFTLNMISTCGTAHFKTTVHADNKEVELRIWDTGGQEQFCALVPLYTRQARAGIIVASVVDAVSIENAQVWKERLHAAEPDAFFVLAINKMDLAQAGDAERIRAKLDPDKFPRILFMSAKTGDGVRDMFNLVGESVATLKDGAGVEPAKGQKSGCC
jgi:small GTP-binding protein